MNVSSPSPRRAPFRKALSLPLATSVAALLAAHTASAVDQTWLEGGPSNNWNTTEANWSPAGATGGWNQNNSAIFGGVADAVTLTEPIFAAALTFNSDGYVLNGNTLTLAGTPAIGVANAGQTASIASIIAGSAGLTKTGAGTLVLSGANTYTGTTSVTGGTLSVGAVNNLSAGTVNLNGGALAITTGNLAFTQAFSIGASGGTITMPSVNQTTTFGTGTFSGAGTLTLNGTGITVLNGTNSGLTGGVVINTGRIQILTNAAAVGTGTVTVNGSGGSGGQLFGTVVTLTNNFILSGFGGNLADGVQRGALRLDGGTANGAITFAAAAGIGANATNTATINGVINAGGFEFRKSDTGTVNLSAANTNFGNIVIGTDGQGTGGTLGITGSGSLNGGAYSGTVTAGTNATSATFNYASLTNQTLFGAMTGVVALIKSGASTLTLGGTNARTGATTVNGGTLKLDYAANDTVKLGAAAGALTFGGGTIELSGGTFGETVTSTALTANTTSFLTSTNGSTAVLHLNGITRNLGATLNISKAGIATTDSPNTNGILGTWATLGQTDWAANSTGGADGLITAPSYTELTRLSGAMKIIPDDATANLRIVEGAGDAGDLTLAAVTTTINTLNQSTEGGTGSATIITGGNNLAVNGILIGTGAGALTIGAFANDGTVKSAGTELLVTNHSTNAATIHAAVSDGAGVSSLVKTGNGTLVLNGTNTFTGATTIGGGTLQIGGAGSLNSGAYASAIANGGTLRYSSSVVQTLSGAITGAGSLVKDTANSTLTLTGANTFAGGMTVSAGTVVAHLSNTQSSLGTGPIALGATGTFTVIDTNVTTGTNANLVPQFTGAAGSKLNIVFADNATPRNVYLANANVLTNFAGTIELSAANPATNGNKLTTNSQTFTTPAGLIVGNGTQLFVLAGNATFNGPISIIGTGNSENRGAIRLTGPLTATGGITLAGNATINTEAAGPISGGAIAATGAQTLTFGTPNAGAITTTVNNALTNGTGTLSVTKAGVTTGIVNLTGANTFTGNIAITTGTLGITGGGSLAGGNYAGNIATAGTFSYGSTAAQTLSGVISGTGGLAKSAASTLTLTGANTYTGATAIAGGTLELSGSSTLNGGAYAGIISGAGNFTKNTNDGSTLVLSGANTHTGITTVNNGILQLTNQGGSNSSGYVVGSGATLDIQVATGPRTMATASTLSGAGTFVKSGSGTLQWTPAATFNFASGALIDVQGGTLVGGNSANEVWTNNRADLNVAAGATFDAVEGSTVANGGVFVDALTGSGTIRSGYGTAGQYASKMTFGVDNGSGTFAGVLADSLAAGNFVKAGNGTQTLSGISTHTGTTTVNAGVLLVTGSISGSATTVNPGGTLGGTGTVGAVTVNPGGTLAPGPSVGILSAGNTTFAGGTFALEINGATAGTGGYDQLNVAGSVSLTADTPLTLALGYTPANGVDTFIIVNNDSTEGIGGAGSFFFSVAGNQLSEGEQFTVGAQGFTITYAGGTDSNDVVLAAVPEPSAAVTLLAGLGMLTGLQRSRRRRA